MKLMDIEDLKDALAEKDTTTVYEAKDLLIEYKMKKNVDRRRRAKCTCKVMNFGNNRELSRALVKIGFFPIKKVNEFVNHRSMTYSVYQRK